MPAARPSKDEVLTAYRRGELIAAARRVFGTYGFEHATMEAIADEARVAKGTIYLYYRSKQAIYDATFTAGMAELRQQTDARVAAAATLKDAIAAFVDVRVLYFHEHPDYFYLYATEITRQLNVRARRNTRRTLLDGQTEALQRAFEQAIVRGEMRQVDAEAAALAVFDITRGLIARRLLTGAKSDAARDTAFLTELVCTGLARRDVPEGPLI